MIINWSAQVVQAQITPNNPGFELITIVKSNAVPTNSENRSLESSEPFIQNPIYIGLILSIALIVMTVLLVVYQLLNRKGKRVDNSIPPAKERKAYHPYSPPKSIETFVHDDNQFAENPRTSSKNNEGFIANFFGFGKERKEAKDSKFGSGISTLDYWIGRRSDKVKSENPLKNGALPSNSYLSSSTTSNNEKGKSFLNSGTSFPSKKRTLTSNSTSSIFKISSPFFFKKGEQTNSPFNVNDKALKTKNSPKGNNHVNSSSDLLKSNDSMKSKDFSYFSPVSIKDKPIQQPVKAKVFDYFSPISVESKPYNESYIESEDNRSTLSKKNPNRYNHGTIKTNASSEIFKRLSPLHFNSEQENRPESNSVNSSSYFGKKANDLPFPVSQVSSQSMNSTTYSKDYSSTTSDENLFEKESLGEFKAMPPRYHRQIESPLYYPNVERPSSSEFLSASGNQPHSKLSEAFSHNDGVNSFSNAPSSTADYFSNIASLFAATKEKLMPPSLLPSTYTNSNLSKIDKIDHSDAPVSHNTFSAICKIIL